MRVAVVAWVVATLPACGAAPLETDATTDVVRAPENLDIVPTLLRPGSPEILGDARLGDALDAWERQDAQAASLALAALRRAHPLSPEASMLHAWSLLQAGELDAAWQETRVLDEAEGPALAYVQGGILSARGELDRAAPYLKVAAAAAPADRELQLRAARASVAAGDGDTALEQLRRLFDRSEATSEERLLQARALGAAGRHAECLGAYDAILADSGEDPQLWNEAGLAAFQIAFASEAPEDYERAARYFAAAGDLDPQDPLYQFNLGCALDWGRDSGGAETAYLRAVELRPGYLSPVENLVELYLRQGRREEARRVLTEQLRQPLTAEEVERVQRRLASIQG